MNIFLAPFESITGLPDFVGYIFIFLFGAAVGSFLNVVIHRVPLEESIFRSNGRRRVFVAGWRYMETSSRC
ncbi:MAG: prepilin peptidase [Acidobacteria bacterium]|nr:prepilin peptidase [Acidobacteriota bacterium]